MISFAKSLLGTVLAIFLGGVCLLTPAGAQDAGKDGPLIITDATGKEQKIKAWKFSVGTRHLTWLAPAPADKPAADPKDKPPVGKPLPKARPALGPEALEFRDDHSTNYVDGILTLIPLDRIRAIEYDDAKQSVTAKVVGADKAENDEVLTGTTRFRSINKLTIEAEVDKGELGVAEVKFQGGIPKGIRSLTFPKPKAPAAAPAGRPASITIADKEKHVHKSVDLQPLYLLPDGSERLHSILMFKKTLKVDVAKVQKLRVIEGSTKGDEAECVVTMKDGEEITLTLIKTIAIGDQQAVLQGLLGRVSAGYKLFPVHTIGEIQFDEAKKE